MEFKAVKVEKPADVSVIIGQSHFIKSVEDIFEAVATSSATARFGVAFCESSGDCLVRAEGNDEELKLLAASSALRLAAGHAFMVFLRGAYPVNVLNAIKSVPEVCTVFCATANPVDVVVAETGGGRRGVMGVIDGEKTRGAEGAGDVARRKEFLRKLGYKL
ncbi:MAG: adenosine-specific kinase [Candidatus ainarchaeum sp.]|nr:adenosine-specific kinase [Candidatus ainarchaeum sp.]